MLHLARGLFFPGRSITDSNGRDWRAQQSRGCGTLKTHDRLQTLQKLIPDPRLTISPPLGLGRPYPQSTGRTFASKPGVSSDHLQRFPLSRPRERLVERRQVGLIELQIHGGAIVADMGDRASLWDGDHAGTP